MKLGQIKHKGNGHQLINLLAPLCVLALALSGCGSGEQTPPPDDSDDSKLTIQLSSNAFEDGGSIPEKYACDGEDVSPPLTWEEPPPGTQALALIVEDPDAPFKVFTHWVIYNIPPGNRQLDEAIPTQTKLADGTLQGENDFGRIGYDGPCPPPLSRHQYLFILYALDQPLELEGGASKSQLLEAMQGHILAEGRLTSNYPD